MTTLKWNRDEKVILRKAKVGLRWMTKGQDLDEMLNVGAGYVLISDRCWSMVSNEPMPADMRKAPRAYTDLFSQVCREEVGECPSDLRSRLIAMARNAEEVRQWHSGLDIRKRMDLARVSGVYAAWTSWRKAKARAEAGEQDEPEVEAEPEPEVEKRDPHEVWAEVIGENLDLKRELRSARAAGADEASAEALKRIKDEAGIEVVDGKVVVAGGDGLRRLREFTAQAEKQNAVLDAVLDAALAEEAGR